MTHLDLFLDWCILTAPNNPILFSNIFDDKRTIESRMISFGNFLVQLDANSERDVDRRSVKRPSVANLPDFQSGGGEFGRTRNGVGSDVGLAKPEETSSRKMDSSLTIVSEELTKTKKPSLAVNSMRMSLWG